jgi:hypothetical protein
LIGQAAGAAAALCAQTGTPPRDLSYSDIQRCLLEQGAYLGDLTRLGELDLDWAEAT